MIGVIFLIGAHDVGVSAGSAQSADEVAAKYIAATGGAERWAKLEAMVTRSRSEFFSFDSVWKKPGRLRVDVWSDASVETDVRAFDGLSGWRLNSMEGSTKPRSMSAQEVAELREEVDWMRELVDAASKGVKLRFLKTELVDGKPAHRIEAVRPSGATVHIFIDSGSGLEVQRIRWATAPDGTSQEFVMPVGDYKDVGGLLLPHRVGTATRTYEVNASIPDTRFQRPGTPSERDVAAKKMAAAVAALLPVGSVAPPWTLKDAQGRSHSSSGLAGKIVVLDFWATWCVPCHRMLPELQRLHDEYAKDGVVVIGISTSESGGDPAQLMKDRGYSYQLLLQGESIAGAFHVEGMPVAYVIGRDGRVVHADVGASDDAASSRRAAIIRLLGRRNSQV
jgi:thiol-disulfide isomerase/thioredoxin